MAARSRALAQHLAPRIEAIHADIEQRVGRRFTQDFHRTLDQLITPLAEGEQEPGRDDAGEA